MPSSARVVVNGKPIALDGASTVAELLAQLGLPPKGIAVELNCQIVPKARHAEQPLSDGDQLEIVSLVGGG